MTRDAGLVKVTRGGVVESVHRVSAAAVDARGRLVAHLGDPQLMTFFRSAAKPFQALPLVADGVAHAYDMSDAELAVCCASHSGEPAHVEAVASLLRRIGCEEADLECGAHPPFHKPSAEALQREGRLPGRIHNNCSGKHVGMLAWSRHHGIETVGYRRMDHPVQIRIAREISSWTGTPGPQLKKAIDGCGVVTFAQPLNGMAGAFARLMAAALSDPASPAGRVVGAMTGEPYYVGGTGRLSTRLMRVTGGRVLAKYGAEAVMCMANRERGLGVAIKIEDGAKRAVGPAVVELLTQLDLLTAAERRELDDRHTEAVTNTRGEVVGEIVPSFRVRREGK